MNVETLALALVVIALLAVRPVTIWLERRPVVTPQHVAKLEQLVAEMERLNDRAARR